MLFKLAQEDFCHEWQVPILSVFFFVLFAGNFITTYMVIRKKFKKGINDNLNRLKYKYYDWKKLKTPAEREIDRESPTDTSNSSIDNKND